MDKKRIISVCISVAAVALGSAFGVSILGRAELDPDRFGSDEIYYGENSTSSELISEITENTDINNAVRSTESTKYTTVTGTEYKMTASNAEITQTDITTSAISSAVTTVVQTEETTTVTTVSVTETVPLTVTESEGTEASADPPQTDPPQVQENTEPPVSSEEEFTVIIPESASEYQREVLRLVNEIRTSAGIREVSGSEQLNHAADVRADEIFRLFDHNRPDGREWYSILDECGIQTGGYLGENIAAGTPTPAQVVDQWVASPDHYANILNPSFKMLGIGFYENADDPYHYYWVQIFAG